MPDTCRWSNENQGQALTSARRTGPGLGRIILRRSWRAADRRRLASSLDTFLSATRSITHSQAIRPQSGLTSIMSPYSTVKLAHRNCTHPCRLHLHVYTLFIVTTTFVPPFFYLLLLHYFYVITFFDSHKI